MLRFSLLLLSYYSDVFVCLMFNKELYYHSISCHWDLSYICTTQEGMK